MVQIIDGNTFKSISPKDLIDATYKAAENFQVKAFFEAKAEILKAGKYSEKEFYEIYDAMLDAETERKLVLERIQGWEPMFLYEIADKITEFPPDNVIRDIIYLKEQGYVEEHIEVKTKMVTKKIKGEEKQVEVKEYFYRYTAKKLDSDFAEHYFEPVSIIQEAGICCQCGWCSSICPVNAIKVSYETLEIDKDTCMKCGLCFTVCPRSFLIYQAAKEIKKLDKSLNWSDKIGAYVNTYTGSTTSDKIKEVRQDGGIVTSILHYLLDKKLVDAIIAVQHSKDIWKPEPVVIEKVEDLYKTGGTKYANSPSLTVIDQVKKYEKIAFVGVPCMMKAIAKSYMFPSGLPFFKNIKYTIGLFCMESFPYDGIIALAKEQFNKELDEITKMNIGGGKFIINLKSGEQMNVPLKDVQKYARHNCHFCEDLTSDYADISVGSIGSQDGWSSIITRSKEADDLLKAIIKAKKIETKPLKDVKPGLFLVERIGGIKRGKCKPIDLSKKEGHD
ncbi:MAG: Coenzyme F420 hydrogenase/dehydrogenase, beta subunit C-terminal domain [Promethearchaeota archaeon]